MRRRAFIKLLGGAAVVWPLAARSQQQKIPVVGYLSAFPPEGIALSNLAAFRKGLAEAGFTEGRNLAVVYRWADGHYDRLPAMAADLVRLDVSVIATAATPAAIAAKSATTTIPIVFSVGNDPVQLGLVASLARPGGNVTGAARLNQELGPKRLDLMHELVPTATRIALIVNSTDGGTSEPQQRATEAAARTLGLQLHILRASNEAEIDEAFATLVREQAGALVITNDAYFSSRMAQFAALALRHRVPTIYSYREFTAAGGLMSYSASFADSYRIAGTYVGRILKGEKPAGLPVQQSTEIELFINVKTAKALGLAVPIALRLRATEVFE